jgi:hypothetical protein
MGGSIMENIIYQISTEHNIYPNLTVHNRIANDEAAGWRVTANEGYMFYDANANNTEIDLDTGEEIPVTYYYKSIYYPRNYKWTNFALVAVLEDQISEGGEINV